MKLPKPWLIICTAMLVFWQGILFASDQVNISIGSWTFEQRSAQNLNVELLLTKNGLGFLASAEKLTLAEPIGQLKNVTLRCNELQILSEQYSCNQGTIAFKHAELGSQQLKFSIKAKPEKNSYELNVANLTLAEAKISFKAKLDNKNWHVLLDVPNVSLNQLVEFVSAYVPKEKLGQLDNWSYDADLTINAELQGQKTKLNNANVNLTASSLNFSDSQGKYIAEDTELSFALELEQMSKGWKWHTDVEVPVGYALSEPVLIEFSNTPFSIAANGIWYEEGNILDVQKAHIRQQGIAELDASFTSDFQQINKLEMSLKKTAISTLYPIWIQPFLVDTALANVELAGDVALQVKLQEDDYQITTNLFDVFIDDNEERFGLYGLDGDMAWTNGQEPLPSHLTWQGGYVYAIPIEAAEIFAETKESQFHLSQTWNQPILDGELQINEFSLQQAENENAKWRFDGLLTPISMEALSSAFGWPTLHGKLSGVIPKVSYKNQHIQVDGALMMKVFNGTTIIRDLSLDEPFGVLPQLYANVDITGLDLKTLTKTFDFGKITGKLDGQIKQLRLSNWQPVNFDARFYTPDGDKSKRRISQKAVDNLSKIGGGAGGLLSRSFLRFFEDFSYKRLGLSCKLSNDVCEMNGVSEAEQGYYIVKGGGLPPRINVVGYTRRVDWTDLIERLKNVSQSSGPTIQ